MFGLSSTINAIGSIYDAVCGCVGTRNPEAEARRERERWFDREHMPEELRRARLLCSEVTFQIDTPVPLVGKPDLVYVTRRGDLIPVENKTRHDTLVYLPDAVQLSIYGILLRRSTDPLLAGFHAASWGYVRVETPFAIRYGAFRLMSERAVIEL